MPVVKIKTKIANICALETEQDPKRPCWWQIFESLCRNQDPSPGGGCWLHVNHKQIRLQTGWNQKHHPVTSSPTDKFMITKEYSSGGRGKVGVWD